MLTDRSAVFTYSLRNCEIKLAVLLAAKQQLYKKKNSFSYSGAVPRNSLSTNLRQAQTFTSFKSGKHKHLLVLNLAAGVSFLIMNKLINPAQHSWKAGIFLLLLFLLLLDLISSWSVF